MMGSKNSRRLIFVFGLALLLVIGYGMAPDFFQDAVKILKMGDIAYSVQLIQSYGQYARLVIFLIIVLINVLVVLPNVFLLAAAGAIFGVVEGTLIAWLAETIGVNISFLLMRYLFRTSAERFIENHKRLNQFNDISDRHGFRIILLARCVPYIPSGAITAMAALSSVGFKEHFFATLIGKLPSALVEVTVGHDLLAFHAHLLRLFFLLAGSLAAYFLFRRYQP